MKVKNKLLEIYQNILTITSKKIQTSHQNLRALVVLKICIVIGIFLLVDFRDSIPTWMYLAFKYATYPLVGYLLILLILVKKVHIVLKRIPLLSLIDLVICMVLISIGAGWRSSYLFYCITSIIFCTMYLNLPGSFIASISLIFISLIKDPDPVIGTLFNFDISDMDMRLGAALAFLVGGIIIGYFWFLLVKVQELTAIKMEETRKKTIMEQKMNLALNVHDTIKSKLSAIILFYKPLLKSLFISQNEKKEDLIRLWKWLHYLQDETSRLYNSLKNQEDFTRQEQFNLIDFINEERSLFMEISNFIWDFKYKTRDIFLPVSIKQSLIQFIGEGMLNAWKHSGKDYGVIEINKDNYSIILTIRDNGRGFILKSIDYNNTSGIKSLQQRAEEIQATLTIETQPKKGCLLSLKIPNQKSL